MPERNLCLYTDTCLYGIKGSGFEQLWSGKGCGVDYCGLKSGMVFKENTRGGGGGVKRSCQLSFQL